MTRAREVAELLRDRMPPHTFKAIIKHAAALPSDAARASYLGEILAARERSEELDETSAA